MSSPSSSPTPETRAELVERIRAVLEGADVSPESARLAALEAVRQSAPLTQAQDFADRCLAELGLEDDEEVTP